MENKKELMLWKAERLKIRGDRLTERAKNHPNKELLLMRAERMYNEAEKYRKAAESIEE